ncbi:MAG TPA: UdgX family uracil-DNA binding protein [Pseudonocardiaceae bacterium]|jgi:DNA polymerase|nr:UdgX family uracil-DNA binding protein [Pseudonocardiaceae bacterium]
MAAKVPESADVDALRAAAATCTACDLHRDATRTVFGDGPEKASLLVVGEQPGDREDRDGQPFVGPAGHLLDRGFDEAGIERHDIYLTNAVKHFKFRLPERGKRRIHQKPNRSEVLACQPWLLAEIRAVRPKLVLCLGATAAQSLLGASFRLTAHRGELLDAPENLDLPIGVMATTHPSAVLRAPDRDEAYAAFLDDLVAAAKALGAD